LLKSLQEQMLLYAESMRFEEAATLRDRVERIRKSELISHIDLADKSDYDIFAIATTETRMVIIRLFMRQGIIVSSSHNLIHLNHEADMDEAYERALMDFYSTQRPPIIAPILVADDFAQRVLIETYLTKLFGQKVTLSVPQRGNRKKLVNLAMQNASEHLKHPRVKTYETTAQALQTLCALERFPQRIEVFDNSHMATEAAVGGMITYDRGSFDKSGYRHYHLEARDEYAQMRETLRRRIESFSQNPPPDLWIIDGGSTLRSLAQQLLESNGVNLDVIAISKEKIDAKSHRAKGKAADQLHTQDGVIKLPHSDKRLQWVQYMRDEAHRFAITFHQKTKRKRDQQSKLLNAHGITTAKITKLLKHFSTFEHVYSAEESEIASILNTTDAKTIKNLYN